MATLKEKIQKARDAGVPDSEIWAKVQASPEYQKALAAGQTADTVSSYLGFKSDVLGTPISSGGGAPQSPDAITAENPNPVNSSNVVSKIGKVAGLAGAGLVKGAVEGTVGLPGTILGLEDRFLPTAATDFLKKHPDVNLLVNGPLGVLDNALGGNSLPTGQSLEGHMNALGLDAGEPQGKLENYVDAMSRGAGAGIATAPLGGVGVVSGASMGALSGLGAETAHELVPTGPFSEVAPLVGGLIAGLPSGGTMAAIANNSVKRLVGTAEGEAARVGQDFFGLQGAAKEAEAAHGELLSGKKDLLLEHRQQQMDLDNAHQQLVAQTQADAANRIAAITAPAEKTISDIADAHGTSANLQQAGSALQDDATKWLGQMDQKQQAIWQPVDAKIPNSTPMTLDNFKKALADINTHGGVLEPLNRYFKPQIANQLEDTLGHIEAGQQLGAVAPLTYGDMRTLRTSLGKALSDPKILASLGDSNARQLYGALTQDIRSGIQPLGLADQFDAANAASSKLYDFAGNDLSKLVKSGTDRGNLDPETIANRLSALGKRGGTLLASLREQLPDSVNELASAVIRQGKWGDMSPEAKAALVPNVDARASLEAAHAAKTAGAEPIQAEASQKIADSAADLDQVRKLQKAEVLAHDVRINQSAKELAAKKAQAEIAQQAMSDAEGALERIKANFAKREGGKASVQQLLKSDLLERAGSVATNFLGFPDALSSTVRLGLGALPLIKPAAAFLARNPDLVTQPLRSAYIGNTAVQNSMAPGGSIPGKKGPLELSVRPKRNALGP